MRICLSRWADPRIELNVKVKQMLISVAKINKKELILNAYFGNFSKKFDSHQYIINSEETKNQFFVQR